MRSRAFIVLALFSSQSPRLLAFDGVIDPDTINLHERVRYSATPSSGRFEGAIALAMDVTGNYFTGWNSSGVPDFNSVPPVLGSVRKFNANGSLAWLRVRSITTFDDGMGNATYTESWGDGVERPVSANDAAMYAKLGGVVATSDGGAVAEFDLQKLVYGNEYFLGQPVYVQRIEFSERSLFVKFDANGTTQWRTITNSPSYPARFKDLKVAPDGSIVTLCFTGAPYEFGATQTSPRNNATLVRQLDGVTGALIFQGQYGGDNANPVVNSTALGLAIDPQSNVYVLSAETPDVYAPPPSPREDKNVVRRLAADGSVAARLDSLIFNAASTESEQWDFLAVDGSGNIYAAGTYAIFGATGSNRAFALKYDANLQRQWRGLGPVPDKYYSDQPGVGVTGLHVTGQGVTVVGYTHSGGVAANENKDFGEVMRLDLNGNRQWHRYLEAQVTSPNGGSQILLAASRADTAGNVYALGFQTFDVNSGSVQGFLTKYASDGALQFVKFIPQVYNYRTLLLAPTGGAPTVLADVPQTPNTSAVIDFDNPANQAEPSYAVSFTAPTPDVNFGRHDIIDIAAQVTPASAPGLVITKVEFYLDGNLENGAGSAPYTDELFTQDLAVGAHTLVAKAYARGLDAVSSAELHFTVAVDPGTPTTLTVNIVGPANSGTVTPGFAGTTNRGVADVLVITAFPNPGFLFAGWTGGATSSAKTLHLTVAPDMVINANFVANPFVTVGGTYVGLGDALSALSSISVDANGGFTAKVTIGKLVFPFKGVFNADGTFDRRFTILQKDVDVSLQLDVVNGTDTITGTITIGGVTYDLGGSRNVFSKTHPAPQAGLYTFIVPSPGGTGVPVGDSWFTANVHTNGKISIVGALADGTSIKRGGVLGAGGSFALYASFYKGKGLFASDLTFVFPRSTTTTDNDVSGAANWQKPMIGDSAAFNVQGQALGSFYARPDDTHTAFNLVTGNLLLHFATAPVISDMSAALGTDGTATSTAAGFSFKVGNKTGRFTGSAPRPVKTAPFQGVVLQKQGVGRGFVSGDATGGVTVTPQ